MLLFWNWWDGLRNQERGFFLHSVTCVAPGQPDHVGVLGPLEVMLAVAYECWHLCVMRMCLFCLWTFVVVCVLFVYM